jgi:hypothetical protein
METILLKKNPIQCSEGNEENEYPVPDPNKTMIKSMKEPSDSYRNILKEEIFTRSHQEFHGEDTKNS